MCGIVGIIGSGADSKQKATPYYASYQVYRALLTLQHRGQDAAGILSYDNHYKIFSEEKNVGLVAQVFDQEKIESLTGEMAIGHTRYATAGGDGKGDIQPMVTGAPFGLGMVHNGNLLNYYSLAKKLKKDHNRHLLTSNDLEVLMNYWDLFLLNGKGVKESTFSFDNIARATEELFDTLIGGYAVLGMIADHGMFAFRDPNGIRPLSLGVKENEDGGMQYCVCSETVAMNYTGHKYLREIEPGELVFLGLDGSIQSKIVKQAPKTSPCMFEWVYFSAAESEVNNQSVYGTRLNLGTQLGLKAQKLIDAGDIAPDVVMPVPDTSRTAAISVADKLNLPYREGLIKNRYVYRSFILNTQKKREEAVELKLSPIKSEIEGKRILLIDDSVVRGTTSKQIIALLKKNGAKEVVLGITSPPLRHSCYYGIDFPDEKELIANDRDINEIEKWVEATKVIYLGEDDLREAIGHKNLCMACVNNCYPTKIEEGKFFAETRKKMKNTRGLGHLSVA